MFRLIFDYSVGQGSSQFIGLLAGLLFVNFMPVREFALYSLGLSALSFLSTFSDLGITGSLPFFRREALTVNEPFTPYLAAVRKMRRSILAASLILVVAVFPIFAIKRGFGILESSLVMLLLCCTVWFQISGSLNVMLLRLNGAFRPSYASELFGNLARLAVAGTMVVTSFFTAWLAMFAGLLGGWVTQWVSGRYAGEQGGEKAPGTIRTARGKILRYLAPTLPSAVYYAFQSPLMVWLAAVFGKVENIAQVSALGRLGLIISFLSGFIGIVLIPKLSGITEDRKYLRRYVQIWAALLPIGTIIIVAAYFFPDAFLLILGKNYQGLSETVVIVAASAVFGVFGAYSVAVNNARGWIRWQPGAIAFYATGQLIAFLILGLETTKGVLIFGLCTGILGFSTQIIINIVGFRFPSLVAVKYESKKAFAAE